MIRIPIKITVFNKETNELVTSATSRLKSKASTNSSILLAQYGTEKYRFEAQVMYSKKMESQNTFEFTSTSEFKRVLEIDLETDLLRDLLKDGMLDKEHVPGGL